MESLYTRFESYDFSSDARFQEGLNRIDSSAVEEDLMKLKLFFYNRFVEPIQQNGYKQWRALSNPSQLIAEEINVQDDLGMNDSGKVLLPPQTDMDTEPAQIGGQLTFAEVFRMIQAGEEIPGLQKLDIKPCNQLPTSSQMTRKLKPWEK